MPDRAYTVSPVISTDSQGREVISDLSVTTNGSSIGHDGQVKDWQNDYYTDNQGQVHHRYSDVAPDVEDQGISFNEDEYIETLLNSNPMFSEAQQWANENLSSDQLDEYNRLIDTSDLDDLHKAMDWLVEQYTTRVDTSKTYEPEQVEEEVEADEEELTDSDRMAINAAVHSLNKSEALDYMVDDWEEHIAYAEQSGDETYATVAAATASFHAGEVTAQEAIDYCMANCNMKELARVYKHLMT